MSVATNQNGAAPSMAEHLAEELKHAPTHIFNENDGSMRRIKTKPVPPEPMQVALMEDPQFLLTGLAWAAADMAFKVDIAVVIGAPTDAALHPDIFNVLPEQSKLWLQGWQMQVNTGSCWRTAGSIGRQAHGLIEAGYLLAAKEPTKDWIGHAVATRDQVQAGMPGSAGFVEAVMGRPYLDWISSIR